MADPQGKAQPSPQRIDMRDPDAVERWKRELASRTSNCPRRWQKSVTTPPMSSCISREAEAPPTPTRRATRHVDLAVKRRVRVKAATSSRRDSNVRKFLAGALELANATSRVRYGGAAPPVLLLHMHPRTHAT